MIPERGANRLGGASVTRLSCFAAQHLAALIPNYNLIQNQEAVLKPEVNATFADFKAARREAVPFLLASPCSCSPLQPTDLIQLVSVEYFYVINVI